MSCRQQFISINPIWGIYVPSVLRNSDYGSSSGCFHARSRENATQKHARTRFSYIRCS
jgi:hypothetical protein